MVNEIGHVIMQNKSEVGKWKWNARKNTLEIGPVITSKSPFQVLTVNYIKLQHKSLKVKNENILLCCVQGRNL